MNTPGFKEDHISQIPALQMPANYLNLAEAFLLPGLMINLRMHHKATIFVEQNDKIIPL